MVRRVISPSFQCHVALAEDVVAELEASCADVLAELRVVLDAEKQAAVDAGQGVEAVLATLQREFLGG